MSVHVYRYMRICVRVYISTCMGVFTLMCMLKCMYVCMYLNCTDNYDVVKIKVKSITDHH